MMERSDAADRMLAALANDPIEATDPNDPMLPMDIMEPIEPNDSTDPVDRTLRIESFDRYDHRQPSSSRLSQPVVVIASAR